MDNTSLNAVIINGILILTGIFISLLFPLIRDFINNRSKIRLEKVKLHDKDRIEAYKRLFVFARELRSRSFPLAENKREDFKRTMSKYYNVDILPDSVYFDSDILEILDEFEDRYSCIKAPELLAEIHPEEHEDFFENKLYSLSIKLEELVKKKIKP